MPKLLKPIKVTDRTLIIKAFCACLDEEGVWRVLDRELGSPERGIVDILAVDAKKKGIHLITICQENIEEGLVHAFKGYRWFRENLGILRRIFSPQDINYDIPIKLIIFIEQGIADASRLAQEICKVQLYVYRYMLFGQKDDPMLFFESLDSRVTPPGEAVFAPKPHEPTPHPTLDIPALKKRLKIELADLEEKEIQEFLDLDLP